MEKVYIESSIPSYLVIKPSLNIVTASRQATTWQWWEKEAPYFDVFVSTTVIDEISAGNPTYANERLKIVADLPVIKVNDKMLELALELSAKISFLPASAWLDLVHISVAIVSEIDYLLTWNCKHIANGQVMRLINRLCVEKNYYPTVIVTPNGLMLKSGEEVSLDD